MGSDDDLRERCNRCGRLFLNHVQAAAHYDREHPGFTPEQPSARTTASGLSAFFFEDPPVQTEDGKKSLKDAAEMHALKRARKRTNKRAEKRRSNRKKKIVQVVQGGAPGLGKRH